MALIYTWVIDVRELVKHVSIATLPKSVEEDFCKKVAKFGPHSLHENLPSLLQTDDIRFSPPIITHLPHPQDL